MISPSIQHRRAAKLAFGLAATCSWFYAVLWGVGAMDQPTFMRILGAGVFAGATAAIAVWAMTLADAAHSPSSAEIKTAQNSATQSNQSGPNINVSGSGNTLNINPPAATGKTAESLQPQISFQKFALFWVNIDKNIYQFGIVAKLFNLDDKPRLINAIYLSSNSWTLFPRGGGHIQNILENKDRSEIIEDNFLKANSEGFFKKMLPIKFEMQWQGPFPEFVIRADWRFVLKGADILLQPSLFSTYNRSISTQEWDDIGKAQSTIDVQGLHYKAIPPQPITNAPLRSYMMFNRDRSAIIEDPYFGQTPPFKGPYGVILFIRGMSPPPTEDGWIVLGNTYAEVWADPQSLLLYNSTFPPDDKGLPQPFGFFAGAENEMVGPVGRPMFAATTRPPDIIDFTYPPRSGN